MAIEQTAALHTVMAVADFDVSVNFYEQILGLVPFYVVPGRRAYDFGGDKFMIHVAPSDFPLPAPSHKGWGIATYMTVDDVDAMHTHLVNRGVRILQPPTTQIWGERDMLITDPDGYYIGLTQKLPNSWRDTPSFFHP